MSILSIDAMFHHTEAVKTVCIKMFPLVLRGCSENCLASYKNYVVEFMCNNKFGLLILWPTCHLLFASQFNTGGCRWAKTAANLHCSSDINSHSVKYFHTNASSLNSAAYFSLYYSSLTVACRDFVHIYIWLPSAGPQLGILGPWRNIASCPLSPAVGPWNHHNLSLHNGDGTVELGRAAPIYYFHYRFIWRFFFFNN